MYIQYYAVLCIRSRDLAYHTNCTTMPQLSNFHQILTDTIYSMEHQHAECFSLSTLILELQLKQCFVLGTQADTIPEIVNMNSAYLQTCKSIKYRKLKNFRKTIASSISMERSKKKRIDNQ